MPPTATQVKYAAIHEEAHAAGLAAAEACTPTPMLVGTPKNLLGSLAGGDGGGFDESKPVYYVPQGMCGFAWVEMSGRGYGAWLKAQGLGSKGYPTGVHLWVSVGQQSIEIKEAYARAYATVLRSHGITAYPNSRLD